MGARAFQPPNRLASILTDPDAPTVAELIDEAEMRVSALSHEIRARVDSDCDRIMDRFEHSADSGQDDYAAIGEIALTVAELGGACGAGALGDIARGLHAMTDSLACGRAWDARVFRLHVETLALMRQQPRAGTAEHRALLYGLAALREKAGIEE